MASLSLTFYTSFRQTLMKGGFDLANDDFYLALLKDTYTPSLAHQYWSEVVGHETSGTGYTANGIKITGQTVTASDEFDFSDVVWTNLTAAFRYPVLYKSTGVQSTSSLIGYWAEASELSLTVGTYTFSLPSTGIFDL